MSEQRNAEAVRKLYSCFIEGDTEGAIDQFSEDAVIQLHFPDGAMPYPNRYEGHEGLRELFDLIDKYYEVEALKDELIQLVVDTVKIPSVNPSYPGQVYEELLGGETKVNEFLKLVIESIGLETDLWEQEKGRANLVGICRGSADGKSLIFNGHVDVVPPGPEEDWTKAGPWSGKIADGKIWGRGSCDMKGGNAAAIIAIKAIIEAGYRPKGDVILEEVVGEEMMETAAGTGATIERGYRADAAIVAEPSITPYPLGIIPASPGALAMRVTIKGKATHVCFRGELVMDKVHIL